jgi:hypothetical protein
MAADPNAVFLNVPFDAGYERQFIALIAALVAIGRTPRCVLEVAETGTGRLRRIIDRMSSCGVSLHDLSRVGTPARFNMPFELGLACALAELERHHAFVLLERTPFRLQRTLSDVNGRDPFIHGGTIRGTIAATLDALRSTTRGPNATDVFNLYRSLTVIAGELKGTRTLFTRSTYLDLVAAAVDRAQRSGLIAA